MWTNSQLFEDLFGFNKEFGKESYMVQSSSYSDHAGVIFAGLIKDIELSQDWHVLIYLFV